MPSGQSRPVRAAMAWSQSASWVRWPCRAAAASATFTSCSQAFRAERIHQHHFPAGPDDPAQLPELGRCHIAVSPEADQHDRAEPPGRDQALDRRQPRLHLPAELRVDVDPRHGPLERGSRGEHDRVPDRRHLAARDAMRSAAAGREATTRPGERRSWSRTAGARPTTGASRSAGLTRPAGRIRRRGSPGRPRSPAARWPSAGAGRPERPERAAGRCRSRPPRRRSPRPRSP